MWFPCERSLGPGFTKHIRLLHLPESCVAPVVNIPDAAPFAVLAEAKSRLGACLRKFALRSRAEACGKDWQPAPEANLENRPPGRQGHERSYAKQSAGSPGGSSQRPNTAAHRVDGRFLEGPGSLQRTTTAIPISRTLLSLCGRCLVWVKSGSDGGYSTASALHPEADVRRRGRSV